MPNIPSTRQLSKLLAESAEAQEQKIAQVLDDIAFDKITINEARERLGLAKEAKSIYAFKLQEHSVKAESRDLKSRFARAMFDVVVGAISPNDALLDVGLPTINDYRADRKLAPEGTKNYDDGLKEGTQHGQKQGHFAMTDVVRGVRTPNEALRARGIEPIEDIRAEKKLFPAPEPLPKPDIYISKHGSHYEMMFHSGKYHGVCVQLMQQQTVDEYAKIVSCALAAYSDPTLRNTIAYDSWDMAPELKEYLTNPTYGIDAIMMTPRDAARALGLKE
jgi:hypothetical protein